MRVRTILPRITRTPKNKLRDKSRTRRHQLNANLETLEPRQLLAGLVISEFLASNDNGIRDEDRNRTDWIEVLNNGDEVVDLDGWFLTDNANDLDRWRFPSIELPKNGRIVVFASGKNRMDPEGELHTNFRLKAADGYLALVQPDGITIQYDFGPSYPPQIRDVSYGFPQPYSIENAIPFGSTARVFVPTEENGGSQLDRAWTELDYDDSAWAELSTPLGYERKSGYEELIQGDVGESIYNINTSLYMRQPFSVDNPDSVYSMRLAMQYDDGYVAYINGTEVTRRYAPEDIAWNSAATGAHKDSLAVVPEDNIIDMTQFPGVLKSGTNVFALHTLNDTINSSDFLMSPDLYVSAFGNADPAARHYHGLPSPGLPNGVGSDMAIIEASHAPNVPKESEALRVTAKILLTGDKRPDVTMYYRTMFEEEASVAMVDDGTNGDVTAGDLTYTATLPAGTAAAGEMLRYRITTTSNGEAKSQLPTFADPESRQKYFGTVVHDPSIQSNLEVFHMFVEDVTSSETTVGSEGAFFHDGTFHDNAFIDTTGRTIGLAGPKKSHDIFFPADNWFELERLGLRMNDFDVMNDFWNRAKVRIPLGYETFRVIGTPAHYSMPIRAQRNGEFHATYSFVDGGNEQFLLRAGLDTQGALYKMNLGFSTGRGQSKKITRNHENTDDLRAFFRGLSKSGEELKNFLHDNLNIPATVNYLVGLVAMGHGDCCDKNLYIYRDTEGTGEWQPLPWDVDSAFGRGGVGRSQLIFPTAGGIYTGRDNKLFKAMWDHIPDFTSMYLKRLRTVLDDVLQPPGTPQEELKFEKRIDEMVALMEPDALLDFEKYGTWKVEAETEKITYGHEGEGLYSWMDHINILKNDYFPARRTHLYNSLKNVAPQTGTPKIEFGEFDANPVSRNQDEEYIQLVNPNDEAVDISGWSLTGDVEHVIHPGTVIPAKGSFYFSPDSLTFRNRDTGPSGGQQLFVQDGYLGHLSNWGAKVQLVAPDQTTVATLQIEADPTLEQKFLRVSEMMYHPRDDAAPGRFKGDDYEFIELVNTSEEHTLNLEHVRFSNGIDFDFPIETIAPNERVVVVRDADAFAARYGNGARVLGEYGRTEGLFRLSNGGELITLEIASGDIIQQFTYEDWDSTTDGRGYSMTIKDPLAPPGRWSLESGWQPSDRVDGTPGYAATTDGDFNQDGRLDATDINQYCAGQRAGDLKYDLNQDSKIDSNDLNFLIKDVFKTSFGDANLDGAFDSSDLVQVFEASEYEDLIAGNSTWSEGDWNCDGEASTRDMVNAFIDGAYQEAAAIRQAETSLTDAALRDIAGAMGDVPTTPANESNNTTLTGTPVDTATANQLDIDLELPNSPRTNASLRTSSPEIQRVHGERSSSTNEATQNDLKPFAKDSI